MNNATIQRTLDPSCVTGFSICMKRLQRSFESVAFSVICFFCLFVCFFFSFANLVLTGTLNCYLRFSFSRVQVEFNVYLFFFLANLHCLVLFVYKAYFYFRFSSFFRFLLSFDFYFLFSISAFTLFSLSYSFSFSFFFS